MKHRKGQNVTDIVAALAVAGLVSAGFSVGLETRVLTDAEQPGAPGLEGAPWLSS